MTTDSESIKTIYKEYSKFILLGLTGRTGSGCSTTAKILSDSNFNKSIPPSSALFDTSKSKIKYKLVSDFIEIKMKKFTTIKITTIITKLIFSLKYNDFIHLLDSVVTEKEKEKDLDINKILSDIHFKKQFNGLNYKILEYDLYSGKKNKKYSKLTKDLYFIEIPKFIHYFKDVLETHICANAYVNLYQTAGDNIRASGKANISIFSADSLFEIPKIIDQLINCNQRYSK